MSYPDYRTAPGFGERSLQPIEDIPTDTEEFLRWGTTLDPDHPYKYELSNGKVSRTMIQTTRGHWRVAANILGELLQRLDRSRFHAGPTEFGVRTGVGVRYPDVIVDHAGARRESLACEAPIFVAEVLSPSTAGLDFTVKLREYKAIGSVQTYLICSQDEPRAWVWQRGPDGAWPERPVELVGRESNIVLPELGIEISMASIFLDIPDLPTPVQPDLYGGLREGTVRQPELVGRVLESAPTETEAFLLWGAQREREEGKFELSRGRVTCDMIWTSRHHARVCSNIIGELSRRLDLGTFDIGSADFAVQTSVGVRSPDVVVDRASPRGRELSTTRPIFIAEVLSPSTAGKDFTEKLDEYSTIDALQTYLICSQDEPRAWVWARQGDGAWPTRSVELTGREHAIAVGGLGIELTMAAVFRGIPDGPTVG